MTQKPTKESEYPYPFLMDLPLDWFIEEHAHVALDLASTPEEAIEALIREWPDEHPLEQDDAWPAVALRCIGKETLLAYARLYDDEGEEQTIIEGRAAEALAGTGDDEGVVWFKAVESGTSEAREWWKIERVELCGKWIEPNEEQRCTLEPGHEGPCTTEKDRA